VHALENALAAVTRAQHDEVTIDSDIAENLSAAAQNGSNQFDEEVNVAYVGFTRAVKRLCLPSVFRTLLTDRWRNRLGAYLSKASSKSTKSTGNAQKNFQSNRRKPGRLDGHVPEPQPRARMVRPSLNIGDKVQTPHGSGKIIEISGDQCLVDLENQPAKLWERLSATKPAP
jgi:ATP-dependent exoDNAse (exonuclease V) beta subunit